MGYTLVISIALCGNRIKTLTAIATAPLLPPAEIAGLSDQTRANGFVGPSAVQTSL
jgi:hypothetical protein